MNLNEAMPFLKELKIVLASKSPRRHAILKTAGFQFSTKVSDFEENLDKNSLTPNQYVLETAKAKGSLVYDQLKAENVLVVSADTIVVCSGVILEKPRDMDHELEMLSMLKEAKEHSVRTAVCIFLQNEMHSFVEETVVRMGDFSIFIPFYARCQEP